MNKLLINEQEMVRVALQALDRAYAPYSKFKVGACVMAEDGSLFGGCNVENIGYSVINCAETVAVCSMIAAGKRQIHAMVVVVSDDELGTPCGRCRQIIVEFAVAGAPIYLCNRHGKICKTVTIEELLPMPFRPKHIFENISNSR